MSKPIEIVASFAPLAARYDLILCDIWGVIHNGRNVWPDAPRACEAFRQRGGQVILISNAPRPSSEIVVQLDRFGVSRDAYDAIVTSGDATRAMIEEWSGRRVYHLGPERDLPIFAGIDVELTDESSADVVVNTGLFDDAIETPEHYSDQLERMKVRGLEMICANPDLMVERGDQVVYCAGALAEAYREIGGHVRYAGKPYLPIYDLAVARAESVRGAAISRNRIIAVGDGLKTDMRGAEAAGIDALFIPSGIHVERGRQLDPALVDELFGAGTFRPVAAQQRFAW